MRLFRLPLIVRCLALLVLSVAATLRASDEPSHSQKRPRFGDYAVSQIYQGTPATPTLSTRMQRLFRTMIRNGAKHSVEFAGHYTVPLWGCGAGCTSFAIADSTSGHVYDAPFEVVTELPGAWEEKQNGNLPERIEFHPDSRLMKINGCPNERNCGFYDYLMVDGEGLKLLQKKLLPKEFQD